jgi:hypothetical protein
MITYTDLVTIFPVFASSDPNRIAQINFYISLAIGEVDPEFYGSSYNLALLYTVADRLAVADFATSSGGMTSGKISARSVDGEYSVTYGSRASNTSVQSGRSSYAELLADLTNRAGLGMPTLDCCTGYSGSGYVAIPVPPAVPTPTPTPTGPQVEFSWGDATPRVIVAVPANTTILTAQIIIVTPFNGVGAALSLGDSGNPERLIGIGQNDPTSWGEYETNPGYEYTSSTQIILTITPGTGNSQGSGIINLEY